MLKKKKKAHINLEHHRCYPREMTLETVRLIWVLSHFGEALPYRVVEVQTLQQTNIRRKV